MKDTTEPLTAHDQDAKDRDVIAAYLPVFALHERLDSAWRRHLEYVAAIEEGDARDAERVRLLQESRDSWSQRMFDSDPVEWHEYFAGDERIRAALASKDAS